MEDKELLNAHTIINEIWVFEKKYYHPQDSEEYWPELINEVERLHRQYNSNLLDQLLLVCVDDIDRRAGAHRGDGFDALYKRLRGHLPS